MTGAGGSGCPPPIPIGSTSVADHLVGVYVDDTVDFFAQVSSPCHLMPSISPSVRLSICRQFYFHLPLDIQNHLGQNQPNLPQSIVW